MRSRTSRQIQTAAVMALGLTFLLSTPVPAGAAGTTTTGQVAVTLNTAVRSITVSPGAVNYGGCSLNSAPTGNVLTFPNGTCFTTTALTVQNGAAPGHVFVNGADVLPADNGTHWTLCVPFVAAASAPVCNGPSGPAQGHFLPGQDQFSETAGGTIFGTDLSNTPACDAGFAGTAGNPSCAAASNQAATESLQIIGPTASTDNSGTFTTTVTWTAVP